MPTNDRHTFFHIKHLPLPAVEPVTFKHFLWGSRGYFGENRSATGQPHIGRPRKVENVITVQKYSEHLRSAYDANAAVRHPQYGHGLL